MKEGHMRPRVFAGACLLVGVLTPAAVAISGYHKPGIKTAFVDLTEPTLIMSTIVQGPVAFIHDEAKMARGEPCTTVKLVEPGKGPLEEIASFSCIPKSRGAVAKFTVRTSPNAELGYGCVLTEYQFAGDSEAHGVPTPLIAH
jgi:hypothetical protein